MSLEQEIRAALAFTGLPCVLNEYTGTATAYLVFNYDTVGALHANDAPQYERQLVQLHLFAPITQNTTALRVSIKQAACAAGYTYPSVTDVSDKSGQHVVFEFEGVSEWLGL